ncbi:MAG: pantetheine-phosphate adenylyltransferase [Prevotellaceae bacterium]|nr:pantetheine-phosphate adenylyltransferase [Prevotellaceae bacterium]
MKTAIFTGSFDPFTIGHKDIADRAKDLFDELVIGIGYNEHKQYMFPVEERVKAIEELYKYDLNVRVEAYDDLTVDFAQRHNADCIIKGVRSVKDFEYEREQAEINRQLSGIETVLLLANPGLECVSSSMVRELIHFDKDASEYIPSAKDNM